MKFVPILGVCACVALLFVSQVRGELLLYEPFDYDPGEIDGQDGGIGFGSPWSTADSPENIGHLFNVIAPQRPMSYTMPGAGIIDGGPRALLFANDENFSVENDTNSLNREFAAPFDADELYFSYLYRYVEGEVDNNDFVIWWLHDQDEDPSSGQGGPNIGLKGNRGDGSGIEDLMARTRCCEPPWQDFAPDWDISDDAGTIGEDFFIVGRLSRAGNSDDPDDYDQFDLWVNPAFGDKDSPQSSGVANPEDFFLTKVTWMGMRTYSQEPGDSMMWDELRIGTAWEDVVLAANAEPFLAAGDADQDLDFDQVDLVKVQIAAKYLTGQPATWGDGDWDGAPGGSPGNPPAGNGFFDQLDIIAALANGLYLQGPYAAIAAGGTAGDEQTSIVYDPATGELAVDAPASTELTSVNIDSASAIFTGAAAENLGGSFDNDADNNIFKATFGSSFGSLSFGAVARAGLSEEFILGDLSVIGSLAGGGDLGAVDLIYVPEPVPVFLLVLGALVTFAFGNSPGSRQPKFPEQRGT